MLLKNYFKKQDIFLNQGAYAPCFILNPFFLGGIEF